MIVFSRRIDIQIAEAGIDMGAQSHCKPGITGQYTQLMLQTIIGYQPDEFLT